MKVNLTLKNTTALLFLSFLMQEAHELAHTSVGRLICGCWGKRNFNLWTLCKGCSDEQPLAIFATYAGPAFSFSAIWLGFHFLRNSSAERKSVGLALIVSNMPISRIITPLLGGGDEVYALNKLWDNHAMAWMVAVVIVLSLALPPVIKLWSSITNTRKLVWMAGLLLIPFLTTGAVVFGVLQTLILNNGFLDEYWVLGSPMLVTLWLMFCLIVLSLFGQSIKTLLQTDNSQPE